MFGKAGSITDYLCENTAHGIYRNFSRIQGLNKSIMETSSDTLCALRESTFAAKLWRKFSTNYFKSSWSKANAVLRCAVIAHSPLIYDRDVNHNKQESHNYQFLN